MRLLLDTHVLLWALMEPHRLSKTAREAIEDLRNEVFVSAASAWEVATKFRLGRLPEAETVVRGFQRHVETLRAVELPIRIEHALLAGTLPGIDRMLAAQAILEGIILVTEDPAFQTFRVATLW
jgi:PIN domain nuclease of toxin-antitoxin system